MAWQAQLTPANSLEFTSSDSESSTKSSFEFAPSRCEGWIISELAIFDEGEGAACRHGERIDHLVVAETILMKSPVGTRIEGKGFVSG